MEDDGEHAGAELTEAGGGGISLLLHDGSHAGLGRTPGTGSSWMTRDSTTAAAAAAAAATEAGAAAAAVDAGSSLFAEAGSVGGVMSPPPPLPRPVSPPVSKSPDDVGGGGAGGEDRLRIGAKTAPSAHSQQQRRHSLGVVEGQGAGLGENNREEGRVSVATSSTSTLPPLDQGLSELLER